MKQFIHTVVSCTLVLLAAALSTGYFSKNEEEAVLKVGFVYSEDESTPYTANFVQAQHAVEQEFGSAVRVY